MSLPQVLCPVCQGPTKVVDVDPFPVDNAIHRRRKCLRCETRFTTTAPATWTLERIIGKFASTNTHPNS